MRIIVLIILFFPIGIKAQLYKAEFVSVKEYGEFTIVGKNAYLDYNLNEMYAELMFNDSIYYYQIKKTGKPLDRKRFVVWFKDTKDTMLWNVSDEGNYLFAFSIDGKLYWFRNLSNPTREEYDWINKRYSSK